MERKYYEAYEDRYKQIHNLGLQWFDSTPSDIVIETIKKYAIFKEDFMLELGCGEGRDAALLLSSGFDLLATDISSEAIHHCRKNFPQYADKFQVLDCISGILNQKFKFIYAVAVIHMLVEDSDREAFYKFISTHLSDNGIALICSMGNGKAEYKTDMCRAFELQPRIHEKSGLEVQVANTSCRIVTFDTFHQEIRRASLSVIDSGLTSVSPDFPCMMYAVVSRKKDSHRY